MHLNNLHPALNGLDMPNAWYVGTFYQATNNINIKTIITILVIKAITK